MEQHDSGGHYFLCSVCGAKVSQEDIVCPACGGECARFEELDDHAVGGDGVSSGYSSMDAIGAMGGDQVACSESPGELVPSNGNGRVRWNHLWTRRINRRSYVLSFGFLFLLGFLVNHDSIAVALVFDVVKAFLVAWRIHDLGFRASYVVLAGFVGSAVVAVVPEFTGPIGTVAGLSGILLALGWFAVLVLAAFPKGDIGPNRYGAPPLTGFRLPIADP